MILTFLFLINPGPAGAGGLLCSLPARTSLPEGFPPLQRHSGIYAGKFLVASRQMVDPVFEKTVILILHFNKDGAMGLIVNRPSRVPLSKLFPQVQGLKKRSDTALYLGGPVELDKIFLLLASNSRPDKSLKIFDGVYVSMDTGTFKNIVGESHAKFRVFAGYAGWAAGQLESEMARGDWYLLTADARTIFETPAADIWPGLIRKAGLEVKN